VPLPGRAGLERGAVSTHDDVSSFKVQAILDAAGSSLDQTVSMTFLLGDPADFAGMNEEWRRWFPTDPPARQGARLPIDMPEFRLSVAAIAEA